MPVNTATPKQRMISAFKHEKPVGRVPHMELVFFLTMEAFGKLHPSQRLYSQWDQMEKKERELHRTDMAQLYIDTARKYEQCAIFIHPNPWTFEETVRMIHKIRELSGEEFLLMIHGDATYAIPDGNSMVEFSYKLVDDPDEVKRFEQKMVDDALENAQKYKEAGGLDCFALCSDYCLNTGPFLSPNQFSEFITPYLAEVIKGYRDLGFYTIKHTDGNIMPIIDQLIQCKPDALHSIDPQAGVDIAEVKKLYGDEVCLIGNVNCGVLDTGTDEQVVEAARYALKHGMPGGGYIFSTSNCIYTGMRLTRYELMLDIWRKEGNYD